MRRDPDKHHPATRLVQAGRDPQSHHGTVNPPIYRASTILQPDLATWRAASDPHYPGYRYGVLGTPTSHAFETAMAETYRATGCVAVSSGLAAVTIPLLALTRTGDHILIADNAYEPGRRFCNQILARFGVETTYYHPCIGAGIAALIRPETRLILLESPGSLTFEMQDTPALVAAAKAAGVVTLFDNTWATALFFNPLDHGVDLVIEAITKYVGGHSDILMGVILSRDPVLHQKIWSAAKAMGNCCGPEELYLALRGLHSMAVRVERCGQTALTLARWLQTCPAVARVLHPALPDDPGHALWRRDFTGSSGLFGFLLHPVGETALAAFFDGLTLFGIGASWGGYESLLIPTRPETTRTAVPWQGPGPLLRIHTGLEHPDDLIADLAAGFERLSRP